MSCNHLPIYTLCHLILTLIFDLLSYKLTQRLLLFWEMVNVHICFHFLGFFLSFWVTLHLVVVVNTRTTSFWVGKSVQFTFWLVFTTCKLVAFNSMTIIPFLWFLPLQYRLQQTNWSVWPLFCGKRWLKHCKGLLDALSLAYLPIICILQTFSTSIHSAVLGLLSGGI